MTCRTDEKTVKPCQTPAADRERAGPENRSPPTWRCGQLKTGAIVSPPILHSTKARALIKKVYLAISSCMSNSWPRCIRPPSSSHSWPVNDWSPGSNPRNSARKAISLPQQESRICLRCARSVENAGLSSSRCRPHSTGSVMLRTPCYKGGIKTVFLQKIFGVHREGERIRTAEVWGDST